MPISRKKKKKTKHKKRRANSNGVPPAVDRRLRKKMEEAGLNYSSEISQPHLVSGLILDFLSPESPFCPTKEDYRALVTLGITAWNIALLDEKIQEEQIQIVMKKLKHDTNMEEAIRGLIARKQEYFGEYKYLIARHEVTFTHDDIPQLSVVSTKID